jgi:hypothetical protein
MKKYIVLAILLVAVKVNASVIPSVMSTGVNDFRNVLDNNSIDFHYLVDTPSGFTYKVEPQVYGNVREQWMNPSSLSPSAAWISFSTDPKSVDSRNNYTYATTFNLDRFDVNSVSISGNWASSSSSSIYVNGNYLMSNYSTSAIQTYNTLSSFTVNNATGFLLPGLNTLTFVVSNGSSTLATLPPNGLLVSMSGSAQAVPEPSSFVLSSVAIALSSVFAIRRRKK